MCFKTSTKIVKKTDEHSANRGHFYANGQKKMSGSYKLPDILPIWFCFKL